MVRSGQHNDEFRDSRNDSCNRSPKAKKKKYSSSSDQQECCRLWVGWPNEGNDAVLNKTAAGGERKDQKSFARPTVWKH